METKQDQGATYLLNMENWPIQVVSVKQGSSFSKQTRGLVEITKLQFIAGRCTDEFFFAGSRLVFHHLTSHNPALTRIYLDYFTDQADHSAQGLKKYVLEHYFVKRLGYKYPEETNSHLA